MIIIDQRKEDIDEASDDEVDKLKLAGGLKNTRHKKTFNFYDYNSLKNTTLSRAEDEDQISSSPDHLDISKFRVPPPEEIDEKEDTEEDIERQVPIFIIRSRPTSNVSVYHQLHDRLEDDDEDISEKVTDSSWRDNVDAFRGMRVGFAQGRMLSNLINNL
jgi:hypothetical protein